MISEALASPASASSATVGNWLIWWASETNANERPGETLLEAYGADVRLSVNDSPLVASTSRDGIAALVDGYIDAHDVLAARMRRHGHPHPSAADLVLHAYRSTGLDFLNGTRGFNARVVVDGRQRELLAARDPLGVHPLFYTEAAGGIAVSPSIDALLALPRVSRDLNRAALADHLCGRWPIKEETYYLAIHRVPSGHVLRWRQDTGARLVRYWDPYPLTEPIPWLTDEEIPLFDTLFEQAVSRCLVGRTGIFLSGGLDSVSVAAIAVDLCRRRKKELPLALSVGFPHPECNEEATQRGVAAKLGMRSEFADFWDAARGRGLLEQALEMSRTMPAPMLHTWNPVYSTLAERARREGVQIILTGGGGDEWLGITPKLAADLIRTGNIGGLVRFLAMWRRSYPFSVPALIKSGFWRYGVRPVGAMLIGQLAPDWWRRNRAARVIARTPAWVAPDPQLRSLLDERTAAAVPPARPTGGFYAQDIRMSIDHTLVSMEFEESALFARRHGLRFMRPYFDIDVVELLYRTPPDILMMGGRSKALVREAVARRFPNLGFEQQKKRAATGFYQGILLREVPPLWDGGGGLSTLAKLGIVSSEGTEAMRREALAGPHPLTYKTFEMLNIEHWTRGRA